MTIPAFVAETQDDFTASDGATFTIATPSARFVLMLGLPTAEAFSPTFTGLTYADLDLLYHGPFRCWTGRWVGADLGSLEVTWSGPVGSYNGNILLLGIDTNFNYFRRAVTRYNDPTNLPVDYPDCNFETYTGNLVSHGAFTPFSAITNLDNIEGVPTPAPVNGALGWCYNDTESQEAAGTSALVSSADSALAVTTEPLFLLAFTFVCSEVEVTPPAEPTDPVTFEYTVRWAQVAEAFHRDDVIEATRLLNERDIELETFAQGRGCGHFEYTHRWPTIWASSGAVALLEEHDRELEEWFATGCGTFEYTYRWPQLDLSFPPETVSLLDQRDLEVEERLGSCTCGEAQ